jgi:hypothetical protein
MSTELQTPAADLHLQDQEISDERLKNIEQEIECPRCSDMMTFAGSGYFLSAIAITTLLSP